LQVEREHHAEAGDGGEEHERARSGEQRFEGVSQEPADPAAPAFRVEELDLEDFEGPKGRDVRDGEAGEGHAPA
jgi:hypothetical protein